MTNNLLRVIYLCRRYQRIVCVLYVVFIFQICQLDVSDVYTNFDFVVRCILPPSMTFFTLSSMCTNLATRLQFVCKGVKDVFGCDSFLDLLFCYSIIWRQVVTTLPFYLLVFPSVTNVRPHHPNFPDQIIVKHDANHNNQEQYPEPFQDQDKNKTENKTDAIAGPKAHVASK